MGTGKAQGKEGQVVELLFQDRAGSCAELVECADHVDP